MPYAAAVANEKAALVHAGKIRKVHVTVLKFLNKPVFEGWPTDYYSLVGDICCGLQ